MLGGLGFPELIVILVIAALIFGPGRLPELGEGLGKAIREFQRAARSARGELEKSAATGAEQAKPSQQSSSSAPDQPA